MTVIVIDTSAFANMILKEKNWREIADILLSGSNVCSLDMMVTETANVIWKHVNRYKRLSIEQGWKLMEAVQEAINAGGILIEGNGVYLNSALEIAFQHDITVYDALFIAQAKEKGATLLTSDKKQREVAENIGIEVLFVP